MTLTKSMMIASAVASMFATAAHAGDKAKAPGKDAKAAAQVKCEGINSCKGTGACGSATTQCAGTNACKGKGWVLASAKDCADKKGHVLE